MHSLKAEGEIIVFFTEVGGARDYKGKKVVIE